MYSDEELAVLLQNPTTQRKAFESMVGQYSERLYWMVRKMVLDHDDANDVLQNTFLKAWNGLSSFHGNAKLSTWLFRIAVNESVDFLRRQKSHATLSADDEAGIANTLMADTYFDGDETQALLHLYREYCEPHKCLNCRIGCWIVRNQARPVYPLRDESDAQ
mgnify:CR=1 FL=1